MVELNLEQDPVVKNTVSIMTEDRGLVKGDKVTFVLLVVDAMEAVPFLAPEPSK